MNKTELIAAIAKDAKFSKTDIEKFFGAMVAVITKHLKKGDKISIPGFMSLAKVKRAARTGRNPQTGKELKIPAKNIVKVKAGKTLVDSVN
jgi:DNA-binding protein HU-beta